MSSSPEELAAIPTAIASIKALQAFKNALGPNPLLWGSTIGGAELIFLGTLQNLVPSLLVSEGTALGTSVDSITNSWVATLQAKLTAG
jgi:hypothetical protein